MCDLQHVFICCVVFVVVVGLFVELLCFVVCVCSVQAFFFQCWRNNEVTYPPLTTLTNASERRKGEVCYLPVTPTSKKGPAHFTWHLTGLQGLFC